MLKDILVLANELSDTLDKSIEKQEYVSHSGRNTRRKQIAEWIEAQPLDKRREAQIELASKLELSVNYIQDICRQYNVNIVRTNASKPDTSFRVIALLLKGKPVTEVSVELGISRQQVSLIKRKAIDAGIEL